MKISALGGGCVHLLLFAAYLMLMLGRWAARLLA